MKTIDLFTAVKGYIGQDPARALLAGVILGVYHEHPDWNAQQVLEKTMAVTGIVTGPEIEALRLLDQKLRELDAQS